MSRWLPDRTEGLHLYVVKTSSWGQSANHIVEARSLEEAKAKHGWTRMRHTSISVRRALLTDADVRIRP